MKKSGRAQLRRRLVWFCLLFAFILQTQEAVAAKSDTCRGFRVRVGEWTFSGKLRFVVPAPFLNGTVRVRGYFVEFDVDPTTFEVTNFTLTGRPSGGPDTDLALENRTIVFLNKASYHGDTLNGSLTIELNRGSLVLERRGSFQSMKIYARDCAGGGLFQMAPEPAAIETNMLGPGFTYSGQPAGEERLCFTNGSFSGYDSPELATPITFSLNSAVWDVTSGGSIGMVIGEDALVSGCPP